MRGSRKVPAKASEAQEAVSRKTLDPSSTNPPLMFVLPENASPDARIVTLPNPATSSPNRYYCCPERGLYEFTRIAAPKQNPRSWLLVPQDEGNGKIHGTESKSVQELAITTADIAKGYSIENADLFVATAVDPIFFLLQTLASDLVASQKQLFLSLDDHLDRLTESSPYLKLVFLDKAFLPTLDQRARTVCDTVEAGDDSMYRLSLDKLTRELLSKAERMVVNALPASMEQKLVQEVLQPPAALSYADETVVDVRPATKEAPIYTESADQSELPHSKPLASEASEQVLRLLRLRTALDFILASYLHPSVRTCIQATLSSPTSPIDFTPLEAHLAHLASLRREAQALRSLSDNISRKRPHMDDEEAEEARAEKKRKKDEEEAKKKNQSRGVKQLAKTDTSGMKKLSSFFTKAPEKKAKS